MLRPFHSFGRAAKNWHSEQNFENSDNRETDQILAILETKHFSPKTSDIRNLSQEINVFYKSRLLT